MDVYLIEIKGAEFSFLASNGNISAKINEGVQQIRRRLGDISENLQHYRTSFHTRRVKAETTKNNDNLLVGPDTPLQVDPDKDVNFYGSVIGGYSKDDREESRIRHQLEMTTKPFIRLDSWNSWFNRLR